MTTLQQLSVSQNNKEIRLNEITDCLSVAAIFSRRPETTTGLTWGFHGGTWQLDGVQTAIANGAVTLAASATNFVQVSRTGVVSTATARDASLAPVYSVITGATGTGITIGIGLSAFVECDGTNVLRCTADV